MQQNDSLVNGNMCPGANAMFWKPDLAGRAAPFELFCETFQIRMMPVLSPAVAKVPGSPAAAAA